MSVDDRQLRASDAEREVVATQLREHAVAGRLDDGELEERLTLALGARTRGELEDLTADLPPPPAAVRRPGRVERMRNLAQRAPEPAQRYAALIALFVVLWVVTGAGYFWPLWPIIGLGIGLVWKGSCGAGGCQRTAGSGSPRS